MPGQIEWNLASHSTTFYFPHSISSSYQQVYHWALKVLGTQRDQIKSPVTGSDQWNAIKKYPDLKIIKTACQSLRDTNSQGEENLNYFHIEESICSFHNYAHQSNLNDHFFALSPAHEMRCNSGPLIPVFLFYLFPNAGSWQSSCVVKISYKAFDDKDHEDGGNIQKESISSTAPFNVVTLHTSRMPGTRKVIPIRTMRNYFINVPLITKNTDNQLLQKELTSMKSQKYWAIRGPLCTISCKQEPALCQTYWRKANIHINYYLKKQKFIFDNL